MGREQQEYNGRVSWAVIVCLGGIGAAVGMIVSMTGTIDLGRDMVEASLTTGALGFVVGSVCGVLLAWLVKIEPRDEVTRPHSLGPQLVGETCVFCGQRIGSIAEGQFCIDCHRPMHFKCVRPTGSTGATCPTCGADAVVA